MVTLPESHTSPQKLASGADGVLGTKVVTTGPWCLERVRLFEFTGELEDYDELEQLEAACAPEESNNESDYTSSTDEEDFETFRGDLLIINPNGIFGLSSYRYVQEYSKFYANGSGLEYSLGAMYAVYNDAQKSASDIAEIGVKAGVEFDDGSALPIHSYSLDLI